MSRPRSSYPTELELEILKVLWAGGPTTVRKVRDELAAGGRKLAHTSIITIMNIMAEKRYLRRTKGKNGFVFAAKIGREPTLGRMLRDIIDRAFRGSAAAAMLNLLETADVNDQELEQIRDLIANKTKGRRL
ncbi:MAG TPA: BlaI/MecI/CopY family transcriptional regulator [Tepidisphaeraceae bacterium]|jgi:predicted transcriptional regulator|nr:BlaI/MecI/CopY family transcriptional regulator [Tepidisphaeraceae bacterium]